MVQIVLEGDTLGARHKYYNQLLDDTIKKPDATTPEKLNYDDIDVNNLFKIDIACKNRNVDYILEVLQSDDLLYVSRALNHSAWLITDPAYAHLIKPEYLNNRLFPRMTTKAINKTILHIRLHLKDETRSEQFYNYFKDKDKKAAFKWLLNCSLAFVENELKMYEARSSIDLRIFKRLCRKSISILEIYVKKWPYNNIKTVLKDTMFFLNTDPEKYLNIVDKREYYNIPEFNAKYTRLILKKCPNRIGNKFNKYCCSIDLPTFAKHIMKNSSITAFLLKHYKNREMRPWFNYDNLKHFVRYIPKEHRFEFIKSVFIDKNHKSLNEEAAQQSSGSSKANVAMPMSRRSGNINGNANIYNWYHYAPFDVAFVELKKLIRHESNPAERAAILEVLISGAGTNKDHIYTLLGFYQDKYINEPFRFKLQFVNNIIIRTKTHLFDDKTWTILNNIFHSLEVYTESEVNIQNCVQTIILYKVLHYEKVPKVIEKKFKFSTMKSVHKKLDETESQKVFVYLHNYLMLKLSHKTIQNEAEFIESIQTMESVIDLFTDFEKDLSEFPWILTKIKKLITLKKEKSWSADLSKLYKKNKTWRKYMFQESVCLSPNEGVCINALKHDANLLQNAKAELEMLCRNDRMSLLLFFSKIRIYWPESLAAEWSEWYRNRLKSKGGYDALARGVCALLPQKEVTKIAKKYAPKDFKIKWSEDAESELGLRKHLAKNIYRTRPQPPVDVVLLYAQGDYLQFALPSLSSVLYNTSADRSRYLIRTFLNSPVSLQKHAIRLVFSKLESNELTGMLSDIWQSTKNATIRAVLFKQTYDLLCVEKNAKIINIIWKLLSMFIDNLSQDEDKNIYITLSKTDNVPNAVKGPFYVKSYNYLKSLPAKANCEKLIKRQINSICDCMVYLESNFVADLLLDLLNKSVVPMQHSYNHILSAFLLCSKDIQSQSKKYEKVVAPYLNVYLKYWNLKSNGYFYRNLLRELLRQLWEDVTQYVFVNDMVFPGKVFKDILNKLEQKLELPYNYVLLRKWTLIVAYVDILEGQKPLIKSIRDKNKLADPEEYNKADRYKIWNDVYRNAIPAFAKVCLETLRKDVDENFSSIYCFFAEALNEMHGTLDDIGKIFLELLKNILVDKDFTESFLMAISAMPPAMDDDQLVIDKEIRKIISTSSDEVKMHYYNKFHCDIQDLVNSA